MPAPSCPRDAPSHPLSSLIRDPSPTAYLESDADEQLLLTLTFLQPTRLKAIVLHTKEEHKAQAPKRVKVFVNRPSLGFVEALEGAGVEEGAEGSLIRGRRDERERERDVSLGWVRLNREERG